MPGTLSNRCLRSPLLGVLVAVSLLAVGAACQTTEQEAERVLVIGSVSDVDSFNELLSLGVFFTSGVIDRMFLSLLEEQPDYQERPPTFRPRLASSYEFSPDRKVVTIKLRKDVLWSDGVPLTSADVYWTWQAQTSPDVAWDYASTKERIADVEVVDSHTIRFHFTEAYTNQLLDLNEGAILPKHAWEKLPFSEWRLKPEFFSENMVSSGPYTLASWKPEQEIILRRNEHYFEEGLPIIDQVIFRIVPDPANMLQQFLSGDIDMVTFIDPPKAKRVMEAKHVDLVVFPTRNFHFISWNMKRPLFRERKARLALTLAIDRMTIIDALWHGYATMATSPIVSGVWAHNDDIEPWPYEPERAKMLLKSLGWMDRDGDGVLDRDGERFSFELTTHPGDQTRIDAIVMIQEQLRRIGVEVIPRQIEFNTLNAKNMARDYDATYASFVMDTSLDLAYAFQTTGSHNWGSFSHPEVDRLIDEIGRQSDVEATRAMLIEIQKIIHEEQPLTFLWEPKRIIGKSARLQKISANALSDFFDLREWSVTP